MPGFADYLRSVAAAMGIAGVAAGCGIIESRPAYVSMDYLGRPAYVTLSKDTLGKPKLVVEIPRYSEFSYDEEFTDLDFDGELDCYIARRFNEVVVDPVVIRPEIWKARQERYRDEIFPLAKAALEKQQE
ncbi:MAG: hypothetical protein HY518_00215 [Candidatus Aenigmarchaeota archaeon]|nr:hypothetical protein [Candidatus Aenigmarchaeota archaeon]